MLRVSIILAVKLYVLTMNDTLTMTKQHFVDFNKPIFKIKATPL